MNSFILFYLFYLANFGYKIKADIPLMKIKLKCESNEYYFDSINHICVKCERTVYNNICYQNNRSIYGFTDLEPGGDCAEDEILTELDDEGKYSGKLMCAKIKQEYTNKIQQNVDKITFSFSTYQNIRRPENGFSSNTINFMDLDNNLISYSADACEIGQYEKSCQYLANLCALTMYDKESFYCIKIKKFEEDNSM